MCFLPVVEKKGGISARWKRYKVAWYLAGGFYFRLLGGRSPHRSSLDCIRDSERYWGS